MTQPVVLDVIGGTKYEYMMNVADKHPLLIQY